MLKGWRDREIERGREKGKERERKIKREVCSLEQSKVGIGRIIGEFVHE